MSSPQKREKNTISRDGVGVGELLDHLTWLGMLPYRWQVSSDAVVKGGVRLQIFQDPGGLIIGVAGGNSLTVEGPTLFSCIGVVRTRIEQKKAELLRAPLN